MKLKLISLDDCSDCRKISIGRLPSTIGRGDDAVIRIEDRWASRCHCEIEEVGGTLVVRDLGSTHGTFINGHAVSEAHLLPGDRLTIGMSNFEAQYKRAGEKKAARVKPR